MPLNDLYHALHPVAFSIGAIEVRWYGLAYLFAFLLGTLILFHFNKRWNLALTRDDIVMVVVAIGFGAIFGARLGYVLFYGAGFYWAHPEHIFAFSEGGMSFHGGLVGAVLALLACCKYLRISFMTIADISCIAAPLGLFLGRIANFINGELWGKPTNTWLGVYFETGGGVYRHPSQLYEALLEGLLLFCILMLWAKKLPPRPQGTFVGLFLLLYGLFRILVEFVRVPDKQLGYLCGPITMGMLLSVPLVVAGIAMLVWAKKTKRPQRGANKQPRG